MACICLRCHYGAWCGTHCTLQENTGALNGQQAMLSCVPAPWSSCGRQPVSANFCLLACPAGSSEHWSARSCDCTRQKAAVSALEVVLSHAELHHTLQAGSGDLHAEANTHHSIHKDTCHCSRYGDNAPAWLPNCKLAGAFLARFLFLTVSCCPLCIE